MQANWEYKTVSVNVNSGHLHHDTIDEQLSELGRQGWELTHVTALALESKTTSLIHHMRRVVERTRTAGFQP